MYSTKSSIFALTLSVLALSSTAAHAWTERVDRYSPALNNGVLRIRSGPGQGHPIVGTIPAGESVEVTRCVVPDDGISQYEWCLVEFEGVSGWASRGGFSNR
jgi:uncharacterized protein YraI